MPKNYFVNVRLKVKQQLFEFIQQNKEKNMKQILGLFSLKTGYKVSTLLTYVDELKDAGLIDE